MCLPSDALSQHLPSYLDFSYLQRGVSSQLLQQSTAAAPYLDEGYLLTATLPDFQHGMAPPGPPVSTQPSFLGCGVAPSSCRHWPRMRDSSSQPSLGRLSLAVQAAAPDLGRGVALGHA